MKVIKEVHDVAGNKYDAITGISMNLLEMIEDLESNSEEIIDDDDNTFYVYDAQYTVTVNGKDIDPKDVKIILENSEGTKPDYYYCDELGEELTIEQIREKQSRVKEISKLTRSQLISRLMQVEDSE